MHAAVGTDDEAHFNFESRFDGNQQRTGCGQRFRRLGIFAARARAHMWDVAELSGASGSLENLMFALGKDRATQTRRRNLHGSRAGGGNYEDKKPTPDAKHTVKTFQVEAAALTSSSARLVPDGERLKYIAVNRFREVRRVGVKAIAYFIWNMLPEPAQSPPARPSETYRFAGGRRVSRVISGGQFRRMGTPIVPKPALVWSMSGPTW
jgi:hypothetical protein